MATIKFLIQSKKAPAGIYVRIKDGSRLDIKAKTPYSVNPEDWSQAKGAPKNREDDLRVLAAQLEMLKAKLLHHYNSSVTKTPIDIEWLKEFLDGGTKKKEKKPNLVDVFHQFIDAKKNEMVKVSLRKYRTAITWVLKYQNAIGKELEVKDVNLKFKRSFEDYFLQLDYKHNTILRAIKYVKTVALFARLEGIEVSNDLDKIKLKFKSVSSIHLNKEEIHQIKNLEIEDEPLLYARDWLLISCETGQRISDFLDFHSGMLTKVNHENQNKTYISFEQKKTKKRVMLPLSTIVLDILEKYQGEFPPKLNEEVYNNSIKQVCCLAGINKMVEGGKFCGVKKRKVQGKFPKWELVSSHIGRRSFASNHYGIIPTPLIMAATGHTTEKQFLEYVGKSEVSYAQQLAQYLL